MESEEEQAPLLSAAPVSVSEHRHRVQENAQTMATQHFYTSHSIFVLSIIISIVKIITSTVVLSFHEPSPSRPIKLWLWLVLVQDICYFVFLLLKIPYIRRVQHTYVMEEPCSVLIFDRLFTVAYIAWLVPGNLWYWKCKDCYEEAPLMAVLCTVYLMAGYGYAVIPLVLLVSVCLCLPVLIVVIMFIANPSQSPAGGELLKSLKGVRFDEKTHKEQTACAICACDFEQEHLVIVLKCDSRHFFHEDCIKKWLHINANCPICRSEVDEEI